VSGSVPEQPSGRDLVRWAETLAAIARTGLGFTKVLYEQERFEEVLKVAAEIRHSASSGDDDLDPDGRVGEWLAMVGSGVAGYVTPKVTVGAVVGNDEEELLLVQRADSGRWLYPTGWADIGYSASEVVVKEVVEETGIVCEVVQPIAILDGMRLGFTGIPLYSLVFHCRMTGGELRPHPLECSDVGFFAEGDLPEGTVAPDQWADQAFAAIRGEPVEVNFDRPRDPVWRGQSEGGLDGFDPTVG